MDGTVHEAAGVDLAALFPPDDFVPLVYDVEDFFGHGFDFGSRDWVSRTNCSLETCSARIEGSRDVARKASSNNGSGQFCLRSLNIILRRWEKAVLTSRV